MSLVVQIQNLALRVATECKSLRSLVNGNAADLSALTTQTKGNLVGAINELQGLIQQALQATHIDDTQAAATTTYSSQKIEAKVAAAVAALVNGAPGALDTLGEIASQLSNDENAAAAMTTAIGNKVDFTKAQALTTVQQAQVLQNIAAAALVHTHVISDVTGLQGALDGKSAVGHTHAVADVVNLQAALDGKQTVDPTLTALAGLVTASDKLIYATGSKQFSTTALTAFGRSVIAATNVAALFTLLGLGTAATNNTGDFAAAVHQHAMGDVTGLTAALGGKQASNALLTAISGIVSAADQLIYTTGTNTVSTATLTAFARSILSAADAPTMRTTLGLGTIATMAASAFAAAVHTHAIADVGGLQSALDSKANAADIGDTTTNFVTAFTNGLS